MICVLWYGFSFLPLNAQYLIFPCNHIIHETIYKATGFNFNLRISLPAIGFVAAFSKVRKITFVRYTRAPFLFSSCEKFFLSFLSFQESYNVIQADNTLVLMSLKDYFRYYSYDRLVHFNHIRRYYKVIKVNKIWDM